MFVSEGELLMYSKHGMLWDDETIEERLASARKFINEKCRERFDDKPCPRGAVCVHEVQCPGTQRRT